MVIGNNALGIILIRNSKAVLPVLLVIYNNIKSLCSLFARCLAVLPVMETFQPETTVSK